MIRLPIESFLVTGYEKSHFNTPCIVSPVHTCSISEHVNDYFIKAEFEYQLLKSAIIESDLSKMLNFTKIDNPFVPKCNHLLWFDENNVMNYNSESETKNIFEKNSNKFYDIGLFLVDNSHYEKAIENFALSYKYNYNRWWN